MVVAGEVSGDIHAGNMLAELRRLKPDISAFGVGGERLAAAGLELVASTDELAHMGLVEVLRELPRIRQVMRRLVTEAERRRPAVAVLVDSPDFNLRLAARLRKFGIPVVLYVSPQLWAWRRGRVRAVRSLAREVLCILPFEVSFYEAYDVPARYVGHPLVDEIGRVGLLDPQHHPGAGSSRHVAGLAGHGGSPSPSGDASDSSRNAGFGGDGSGAGGSPGDGAARSTLSLPSAALIPDFGGSAARSDVGSLGVVSSHGRRLGPPPSSAPFSACR